MKTETLSYGECFKSKRKALNLSLKDVENATSIRIKHLSSIEEEKESAFLSPVYMLGFMRQYAQFLGLDAEKIFSDHQLGKTFSKSTVDQEFSYGIGTLEPRHGGNKSIKRKPSGVLIAVSSIVLISAYYFAKYLEVI